MYYEERIINGVLCYRSSPKGSWIELTKEQLTSRIAELKAKHNEVMSYSEFLNSGN